MPHILVRAVRWNGSHATLLEWAESRFRFRLNKGSGNYEHADGMAVSIGGPHRPVVKFGAMVAPGLAIARTSGIMHGRGFYAAGGKTQGLQKAIASNVSGVVWCCCEPGHCRNPACRAWRGS